jgi:hypothetical protein
LGAVHEAKFRNANRCFSQAHFIIGGYVPKRQESDEILIQPTSFAEGLEVRDDVKLIQVLTFWMLSIVLRSI